MERCNWSFNNKPWQSQRQSVTCYLQLCWWWWHFVMEVSQTKENKQKTIDKWHSVGDNRCYPSWHKTQKSKVSIGKWWGIIPNTRLTKNYRLPSNRTGYSTICDWSLVTTNGKAWPPSPYTGKWNKEAVLNNTVTRPVLCHAFYVRQITSIIYCNHHHHHQH